MAEEKCLFDYAKETQEIVKSLEARVGSLEAKVGAENQPRVFAQSQAKPQPTPKELLYKFLKQSKKSWRWFGTRKEFKTKKTLAIISLIFLLLVGFITTIVSTMCFKLYSTFTLFENAWMIISIIYLVYASKATYIYETNALAASSPLKYKTDAVGMKFHGKEKLVFRIFKWLAIISVVCNIIVIWAGMGKDYKVLATVMEVLFLCSIIFAYVMNNLFFFINYLIAWVEGHNFSTNERVVLVLPPGAKQLMTEEEFNKTMWLFNE